MPRKRPSSDKERIILDFRSAGWPDVMVLGKYHYTRARKHLDAHAHRHMMEICFCSKGEQRYEVNGNYYKLRGGDFFVTYPGEWHGTGIYGEEKGELYWMIIRLSPKKNGGFLHFDAELSKQWTKALLQLQRHFRGNKQVKPKLEKIFRLFGSRSADDIFLRHAVADFLMEAIDCSRRNQPIKSTGRIEKVHRFIDDHMDEPVSLPQLAELSGLSLSRFKTWFREETGSTPLDYVMRKKIDFAAKQLLRTRGPVSDVAYDTGFQSSQYFTTVFRKFTGMTPAAYRARFQE